MKKDNGATFTLKSAIALIAFVGVLGILYGCARQPLYPAPPVTGDAVVIDISSLQPEIPQFFTYQHEGKNISFFVLKTVGKVNSFLDACATCYRHKRGYAYRDESVVCRFCSMDFSVYTLEKGMGGCYPINLEGTTGDGSYRIPVSLLESKARFF
jgi:uncharacterized membrane protein